MPHCGEHLPEEKSLGGDSSHYRLHGGRRSASATVDVGTSDAATISTRRDDRREGFSNRRRRNDQRGDGQHGEHDETAAAAVVAQRTTKRRLQLGVERRRGETSWSHRDDGLRRQTTTQQRGVVDGEFFAERCPLAPTAHTGPAAVPGGSLPSTQSTRTRWITAFRTGTLPPLSTSENSAQTRAKTTSNTLEVTPRSVQLNKYHVELKIHTRQPKQYNAMHG